MLHFPDGPASFVHKFSATTSLKLFGLSPGTNYSIYLRPAEHNGQTAAAEWTLKFCSTRNAGKYHLQFVIGMWRVSFTPEQRCEETGNF